MSCMYLAHQELESVIRVVVIIIIIVILIVIIIVVIVVVIVVIIIVIIFVVIIIIIIIIIINTTIIIITIISTCIGWHQHDRLLQTRNGLQHLQLVFFLHGVRDAVRVDDIAIQALGLQPHVVCAIGEPSELGF